MKIVRVLAGDTGETFVVEVPWQKVAYVSVSSDSISDSIDDCENARCLSDSEKTKILNLVKKYKNGRRSDEKNN